METEYLHKFKEDASFERMVACCANPYSICFSYNDPEGLAQDISLGNTTIINSSVVKDGAKSYVLLGLLHTGNIQVGSTWVTSSDIADKVRTQSKKSIISMLLNDSTKLGLLIVY